MFEIISLYRWIILAIPVVILCLIYSLKKSLGKRILAVFRVVKENIKKPDGQGIREAELDTLYELIEDAGYAYDSEQDIFYSRKNAWQREMGYTRLYDEAAATLGMIIDCEPIYFQYDHRIWLIEFWKGQYGMTTGCEIGVYNSEEPDVYIPSLFHNTAVFKCVEDSERLFMICYLEKDGEQLFVRLGYHWWLTAFKLGEFSWPRDLTMHSVIYFQEKLMQEAFIKGLKNAGYGDNDFQCKENLIRLTFRKGKTPQPLTRTKLTDKLVQRHNKMFCDRYLEITKDCVTLDEKLMAIKEKEPALFALIIHMGKAKNLFKSDK